MYKLVAEDGRWAVRDNSMIFCNVVYLSDEKEAMKYHLIDENREEIELEYPLEHYLKKVELPV